MATITDQHMRLLAWLHDHEGAALTTAAEALGVSLAEVERLVMELVEAGMVERTPVLLRLSILQDLARTGARWWEH